MIGWDCKVKVWGEWEKKKMKGLIKCGPNKKVSFNVQIYSLKNPKVYYMLETMSTGTKTKIFASLCYRGRDHQGTHT